MRKVSTELLYDQLKKYKFAREKNSMDITRIKMINYVDSLRNHMALLRYSGQEKA